MADAGGRSCTPHAARILRRLMACAVVLALASVLLLAPVLGGCGAGEQKPSPRKPSVPALDIRPNGAVVRVGETLRFRVYLVDGVATARIDPALVRWSVTREQGAPGTVRDGLFTAPDEVNDSKCIVRGVYVNDQFAGSSSDVARVQVVSGFHGGKEATGSAQEDYPFATPSAGGERVFDSSNPNAVQSGPAAPTVFSLGRSRRIVYLVTYHYNGGAGAKPGNIEIVGSDGKHYGPWRAKGRPSPKGRPNVYWVVSPGVVLPEGDYTIRDSSPGTWSYNAVSSGRGMSIVEAAVGTDARQP